MIRDKNQVSDPLIFGNDDAFNVTSCLTQIYSSPILSGAAALKTVLMLYAVGGTDRKTSSGKGGFKSPYICLSFSTFSVSTWTCTGDCLRKLEKGDGKAVGWG